MKGRRRGAALEKALLKAAWAELEEYGYAGLTMTGVAARAGTSRPVLARRWDGKADLAIAAIRQQITKYPLKVADHGDLRTELLEYLERASGRATGIAAVAFTLFASEYFQQTRSTPLDFRTTLAGGKTGASNALTEILDRAVERGEIDPDKLVFPVATLLSDLFRSHVIMTFSPPPLALRTAWVDSIFLPLVRRD